MRRALGVSIALLLAAPGTAVAATLPRAERSSPLRWGELPFRAVADGAHCVRATGLPGELLRWTPAGVELSSVSAAGIVATTPVPLGPVRECPVGVSDPGGFAAIAAATSDGVRVMVRESGAWGAPTTMPSE